MTGLRPAEAEVPISALVTQATIQDISNSALPRHTPLEFPLRSLRAELCFIRRPTFRKALLPAPTPFALLFPACLADIRTSARYA